MQEITPQVIVLGKPSTDDIAKDVFKSFCLSVLNEIVKLYSEDEKNGKYPSG